MALYHAKSEGRNRTYIYSEAGFKDLFESGEIPLDGEILSMEDRIRGVNQPFTPSLLRRDTPAVSQAMPERTIAKSTTAEQAKAENGSKGRIEEKDHPETVPSPRPTKFRPTWYGTAFTIVLATLAIVMLYS